MQSLCNERKDSAQDLPYLPSNHQVDNQDLWLTCPLHINIFTDGSFLENFAYFTYYLLHFFTYQTYAKYNVRLKGNTGTHSLPRPHYCTLIWAGSGTYWAASWRRYSHLHTPLMTHPSLTYSRTSDLHSTVYPHTWWCVIPPRWLLSPLSYHLPFL